MVINTKCPKCGQIIKRYKNNPRTGALEYEFILCGCDKKDNKDKNKNIKNEKKENTTKIK